jgi:hypothetical protein
MTKLLAAYVFGAMAFACNGGTNPSWDHGTEAGSTSDGGSNPNGSGGGSGSGSSGGSSSGSGSGSTGGGSSSGGPASADGGPTFVDASAGNLYDAAPPSDADVGQTVTLTADAFTVAAGAEVYKCQVFANPFGRDVDLIYLDGNMSQGSHHFFLFKMDPSTLRTQPTALQDCLGGGLEFHPFPYLSQQPHWTVQYPQRDMGYPLSAQDALMINVHFLNAGSTPIQVSVNITIAAAKPGVVTTHIGTIFLNNALFSVPPTPASSPQAYAKTWTPPSGALPSTYTIFTSWSHMHRTAVDFQASANGAVFYDEKNWDSPQLYLHNPPMQMSGSTPLTWSCSYYNDTGSTLSFGDSAKTAVMCIYMGQYYPVVDPMNPDLIEAVN